MTAGSAGEPSRHRTRSSIHGIGEGSAGPSAAAPAPRRASAEHTARETPSGAVARAGASARHHHGPHTPTGATTAQPRLILVQTGQPDHDHDQNAATSPIPSKLAFPRAWPLPSPDPGAQPSSPADTSALALDDLPTSFTSALSHLPTGSVSDSAQCSRPRRRFSIMQQQLQQQQQNPAQPPDASPATVSASHTDHRAPQSPTTSAFGWLAGNKLVPPATKINKSDEDWEADEADERRANARRRRRAMLAANSSSSSSYIDLPSIVAPGDMTHIIPNPLPCDPNNLLPLSAPQSVVPSRTTTPQLSPVRGLHGDLAADYVSAGLGSTSGTGSSPRTSLSSSGLSASRSYSDSSAGDDDDSPLTHGWWWPSHSTRPVSSGRPIFLPRPTPPRPSKQWGQMLAPLAPLRKIINRDQTVPLHVRRRRSAPRRRRQTVLGSTRLGYAWAMAKAERWKCMLGLFFSVIFVVCTTLTIKQILDPDTAALPWREYCTADQPRLYSLQDPLDYSPIHLPPLVPLKPVTPGHRLWPYGSETLAPHDRDIHASDVDSIEPVGVFLAVFTVDDGIERRNLIRQSYNSHWRSRRPGTEGVRLRFIMGQPRQRYSHAVAMEIQAFNDIVLLDIRENMNHGKTHKFFQWAAENATVPDWEYPSHPRTLESAAQFEAVRAAGKEPEPIYHGERAPDYVAKADDDSFIMLGELERHLRATPRDKAVWGYLVRDRFMAGQCYALSRDLVEYIRSNEHLRNFTRGKEDKLVQQWLHAHPQREDIIYSSERCWIHDHPRAGTVYSHGFLFPDEVARVRAEQEQGLSSETMALRSMYQTDPNAYSSVSRFGTKYSPPVAGLTTLERVEAMVEGSALSQLRDATLPSRNRGKISGLINDLMGARPSRLQRFLGDQTERGGTVLVHYIKKDEWFIETMAALLGTLTKTKAEVPSDELRRAA